MSKIERRGFLKACSAAGITPLAAARIFALPPVYSATLPLSSPGDAAGPAVSPAAPPRSAAVKLHQGKPTLFINDQPVYSMLYALTDVPGGRWTWEEIPQHNLRAFGECGISVFQVDLFLEHVWMADGSLSMDLALKQIRGVLEACPGAAVFIRFHVNAPAWWNEKYPEEGVRFADGPVEDHDSKGLLRQVIDHDLDRSPRHSLASWKWRQEASAKLIEFLKQLVTLPEGNAVAGIQVACGVYGEWHYWGFIEHDPDTGPSMTARFRAWLREKYTTDEALQKVWNDSAASFASVNVPDTVERRRTTAGIFRDPQKERRISDYYQCQHETVAEDIIHFCKTVKENWPRPIVTGTFYGYFFGLFSRQASGGHLEVERVLNSPYVDYLSAPQAYGEIYRAMGNSGQSRGLVESASLHGKLWLDEMDEDPGLTSRFRGGGRTSVSDAVAILRRDVLESYTRGQGLWFYDFGPGYNRRGWWDHPALLKEVRQLHSLLASYSERPYRSPADVLLVFDTACFYYLGADAKSDPLTDYSAVNELSAAAFHSGAALHTVHLDDLKLVDWKKYRTVVFANTFLLTGEQKALIRDRVARDGRHLVWIYAPGYTDGQKLSSQFVAEVVGMKLRPVTRLISPAINVEHADAPRLQYGMQSPVDPFFVVAEEAAVAVGNIENTGLVALAFRKFETSTSWFSSLPITHPDLWRHIFRQSGAHIYSEGGDVIHCGGGILAVHSKAGGKRQISLPSGKTIETDLPPRSTTPFDVETGVSLLT
jgi:hypothetical protein